ncbi:MAG: universal stress protein [Betaproteobacteria bacterium]|nr:universal stress protein [Betaproteobacteria bacterium]
MSQTVHEAPAALRIWVALDESPRSAAALAAAAILAEELDAELAGLFVEDIDVQRLSGLPFAREFSLLTGAGRPLSERDVERTWRQQATALQRQLVAAAAHQRLRWSFTVARGRMPAEMRSLVQALDLIVLGKQRASRAATFSRATIRLPSPAPGPVLVPFEALPASASSLAMGVTLARRNGAGLVVLVDGKNEEASRAACAIARAALSERGAEARCVWLRDLGADSLAQAVRREQASCLVLGERERLLQEASFEQMVDAFDCPIVLTR